MKQKTMDSQKPPTINPDNSKNGDKDTELEKEIKETKKSLHEQNNAKAAKIKKGYALEEKEAQKNIKIEIEADLLKKEELRQNELVIEKLKTIGLNDSDFKDDPQWETLSHGEKLLVIEQLAQETLSHINEIGEKNFQEKNKIKFTFNPTKWKPLSLVNKIRKHITKSAWISKEEKEVLGDVESGKLKPNDDSIKRIIERTKDMGLNVTEKESKASIEFIPLNKKLPEDQQKIIENYNEAANAFAKMPDSWKNEKAAKGKGGGFIKNRNYEDYKKVESLYEKAKLDLLNVKKESYIKKGNSEKIAELKAMNSLADYDKQVTILQFINTNPDVLKELNKIKNENSWGRLLNNENLWRGGYMAIGAGARAITVSTFGLIAAPVVSGIIGGARARKKANDKINKAFGEGRSTETFKERKEVGKKGLFDDKDANRGIISRSLTGDNVSAKEVGAFIDADSQIQRLNNLIEKIEKTKNKKEKLLLKDQLFARINYVEDKLDVGLINYGTKNAIGSNHELLKKISQSRAWLSTFDFIGDKNIEKNEKRRESLLGKIIAINNANLEKKQSAFKNQEMIRGAVIAGGFSLLAWKLKDLLLHGGIIHENINTSEIDKTIVYGKVDLDTINPEKIHTMGSVLKEVNHATIGAGSTNGQGAIATFRQLQKNLLEEYGEKAPNNIKHLIETDAHKLAQEYGMYKPGEINESSLDLKFLKVDNDGNLTYQKIGDDTYYKADSTYEGKMFDSDHSGLKIENNIIDDKYKVPPQSDPTTINETTIEVDTDLTPDEIEELNQTHLENINRIFPNLKDWENIKNVTPAGKLFTMETVAEQYKPLVSYVKNLKEITGLDPTPNETIPAYIKRALQEAQENGNLDKIVYPKSGVIEQIHQEVVPTQVNPEVVTVTKPSTENIIDQPRVNPKIEENTFAKPNEVGTEHIRTKTIQEEIPLSSPDAMKILSAHEDNIDNLFPNMLEKSGIEKIIKNYSAEKFLGENNWSETSKKSIMFLRDETIDKDFNKLSSYVHKLQAISGINPLDKLNNGGVEENINNYMLRAIKQINVLGKLDEIEILSK